MDDSMCSGPLRIDAIKLPSKGELGLTNCPGRCGVDGAGRHWRRDLADDLSAIEAWGAGLLVTFVEDQEFARLGVPGFGVAARGRSFAWRHVPIPDMCTPEGASQKLWSVAASDVATLLRKGGRVVFHCAGGLGRSGTMAALVLIETFGMMPSAAISLVRSHRRGAIESEAQEAFLDRAAERG